MEKVNFRLSVADDKSESMRLGDLGQYLNLLNAFYDAFRADMYRHGEVYEDASVQSSSKPTLPGSVAVDLLNNGFEELFYKRSDILPGLAQDASCFAVFPLTERRDEAAAVLQIRLNSPMDIVVSGISVALSFALILSGGKIEAAGFESVAPPAGNRDSCPPTSPWLGCRQPAEPRSKQRSDREAIVGGACQRLEKRTRQTAREARRGRVAAPRRETGGICKRIECRPASEPALTSSAEERTIANDEGPDVLSARSTCGRFPVFSARSSALTNVRR